MQLIRASEADFARLKNVLGHLRDQGIQEEDVWRTLAEDTARNIRCVPTHFAANEATFNSVDATSHGRSNAIWNGFRFGQANENNAIGGYIWENFVSWGGSGSQGSSGGAVQNLTAALSPAAVGSSTCAAQTLAFTGTLATDTGLAVKKTANQAGLALGFPILISTNGSVTLNFINPTAGAITPTASETYTLTVLRKNGFYSGGSSGGWRSFEGGTTPGSVSSVATEFPVAPAGLTNAVGVISMATGALAHNNVCLEALGGQFGVGANAAATVPTYGALPKLYFEIRLRFTQRTTQSAFFGLATQGMSASLNTMFDSADAWVNNTATMGFRINGATSTTAINAGYGNATAWTTTGSGTVPTTAANYTKLGFVFDATQVYALTFIQDGVVIAQKKLSEITAANWPSNIAMTPTLYLQAQGSGGAAVSVYPDWVAAGQLVTGGL